MKKQHAKWREQSDKNRRDWIKNNQIFSNFVDPGSFPVQATKAETPQIRLHIVRQRFLGERMIGERTYSRLPEILATVTGLIAMLVYSAYRGWI